MTGMLNTLLDINQIEVGAVKAELADFPVNELFDRLRDELTYHAQAAGLALRVMPCALFIRSDPRLLEQMIRNLLSNALKYTQRGKVLVGCRRRRGKLRIEIWDTGIGIPDVGAADDLRGIPSAGQRRPPAQPWPGAGTVDRQEPGRTSRPSHPGALAAGKGLGVLDRGPAVAKRRGIDRLTIVRAAPPTHPTHMRAALGNDPDHRGRPGSARDTSNCS